MKNTWKLFWGLGFIFLAVALVLDAVGVLAPISSALGEVSILAIISGLLLLCFAIAQLFKGKIGNIFLPLALIFMLFEGNIAHIFSIGDEDGNIINNWLLLFCAFLLSIGFGILFSGIRRRRSRKNSGVEFDGHSGNLGSSVKYIDCDGFKYEDVDNNLGSCTVFFENSDKYEGGGVLHIENNLGSVIVSVPEDWNVVVRIDNSLGSVTSPKPSPCGKLLTVNGDNNLGSVVIKAVKKD